MTIVILIIAVVGGVAGLFSTLYLLISLFGVIGYKIFRKMKFHTSLFN